MLMREAASELAAIPVVPNPTSLTVATPTPGAAAVMAAVDTDPTRAAELTFLTTEAEVMREGENDDLYRYISVRYSSSSDIFQDRLCNRMAHRILFLEPSPLHQMESENSGRYPPIPSGKDNFGLVGRTREPSAWNIEGLLFSNEEKQLQEAIAQELHFPLQLSSTS